VRVIAGIKQRAAAPVTREAQFAARTRMGPTCSAISVLPRRGSRMTVVFRSSSIV